FPLGIAKAREYPTFSSGCPEHGGTAVTKTAAARRRGAGFMRTPGVEHLFAIPFSEPAGGFGHASQNANPYLWILVECLIDARDAELDRFLHNDCGFYHSRELLRAPPNCEVIDLPKAHLKAFHSRQVGDSIEGNEMRGFSDLRLIRQVIELGRREHAK